MNNRKDITAIILAGGKSSRMGTDKGVVDLHGRAMVSHVIAAVNSFTDRIIIIANNNNYTQFGYPVFTDLIKDKGPMGGIVTGLHYSDTEFNLLLSCDIPFVSAGLLQKLADYTRSTAIVIAETENGLEPLCGRYHKNCAAEFRSSINAEILSVRKAISALNFETIKTDSTDLVNINTPAELNRYNVIST
jgi:molybdopterin-guanine dinucleotide biosynthesis protein A